jgi:hypothetical protein
MQATPYDLAVVAGDGGYYQRCPLTSRIDLGPVHKPGWINDDLSQVFEQNSEARHLPHVTLVGPEGGLRGGGGPERNKLTLAARRTRARRTGVHLSSDTRKRSCGSVGSSVPLSRRAAPCISRPAARRHLGWACI